MRFQYASGSRPLEGFVMKRGIGRGGFQAAFWAGAAIAFAGVLVSLFLVRGRDLQHQEAVVVEPALEPAA